MFILRTFRLLPIGPTMALAYNFFTFHKFKEQFYLHTFDTQIFNLF